MKLAETKKVTEAHFAECRECGTALGSPYWSLAKSVALHKRGTGHKVTLLRLA